MCFEILLTQHYSKTACDDGEPLNRLVCFDGDVFILAPVQQRHAYPSIQNAKHQGFAKACRTNGKNNDWCVQAGRLACYLAHHYYLGSGDAKASFESPCRLVLIVLDGPTPLRFRHPTFAGEMAIHGDAALNSHAESLTLSTCNFARERERV